MVWLWVFSVHGFPCLCIIGQNRLLDCRSRCASTTMADGQEAADRAAESFQGLLLRYRGRSGLTQRELAARVGVSMRTVENWEAGVNYPSAQPLQALITALLEAGGLNVGRELDEVRQLWAAVVRDAPRMRTPFDEAWLAEFLAERTAPDGAQLARE